MIALKKIKIDSYAKGIVLLVVGIFVLFLPKLLSGLFYFAGAALIIYSIISMALGISWGTYATSIPKAIVEICIGFALIVFLRFVGIGVPIILGILFLMSGVDGFFSAIEKRRLNPKRWISSAVSSVLLVVCGLFLITNPVNVGSFIVKAVGIILLVGGIALIALEFLRSKKPPEDDSVIHVDDYSVSDDK